MFSIKGIVTHKILLVAGLLLLASDLGLAGTPNLPDIRISAEYLGNVYEIDGLSTRWITSQPSVPAAKNNPGAAEQVTSDFSTPGFLQMKSRSGLASGLGVRVLADLPPIEFVDDKALIRSNGISRSSMIRHFTAHTHDGSAMQLGLQLQGNGKLGYHTVDAPGSPFAFERILDAGIELEVILHREGQAPVSIWSTGAFLIKSENVDLPFAPYGDAPTWAWAESGDASDRQVELNLLETYEDLFTVADGETFALEFKTQSSARNYEYPNWQAYSEFYGTFVLDTRISWPPLGDLSELLLGKYPRLGLDYVEIEFKEGSASGNVPVKDKARDVRPPSFAPYIEDQWTDTLVHTNGSVDRTLRAVAGMAPLAGFGQIGSRAELLVQAQNNPAAEIVSKSSARAEYGFSFVPVFDASVPDDFDLDFDLRLDGVLDVEALDAAAFASLVSVGASERSDVWVYLKAELEINSSPRRTVLLLNSSIRFNGDSDDTQFLEGELVKLQDYFTFEPVPGAGPQTGGRLRIDVNTQNLPAEDPLVSSLQNVATVEPGDAVKVILTIITGVKLESADVGKVVRFESDFLDTLSPVLSSDTPGVRFELLDLGIFKDGYE